VSVSEQGLTALPAPGIHRNGAKRYEVRHSKRGRWYALRQEPDGSWEYLAQDVDLDKLTVSSETDMGGSGDTATGVASERQPSGNCPGCSLFGVNGCLHHSPHWQELRK
jgi:hypothetical protein